MGTKSIQWPLAGLFALTVAACVLIAVGAYLFLERWGRGSMRIENVRGFCIVVVASCPGASAEEVERQVTIPLEVTFAGALGLNSVRSKSQCR
jgi:cobalt-zinc-cadmium resistance protein CzcA